MRSAKWRAGAFALALAAGLGPDAAASGRSFEYTQFLPVWLDPDPGTTEHPVPALLNLPSGWQPGDAAVVIAKGRDTPRAMRDGLVSALIEAGTAVLELHVEPGREAALPGGYADALATMRVGFRAGLVAAVGYGWGGPATIGAVEASRPGVGGYNAAIVLDDGAPVLVRGEAPPMEEAWPARAPMLCEVLAVGLGAAPAGFVEGCARQLTLAAR